MCDTKSIRGYCGPNFFIRDNLWLLVGCAMTSEPIDARDLALIRSNSRDVPDRHNTRAPVCSSTLNTRSKLGDACNVTLTCMWWTSQITANHGDALYQGASSKIFCPLGYVHGCAKQFLPVWEKSADKQCSPHESNCYDIFGGFFLSLSAQNCYIFPKKNILICKCVPFSEFFWFLIFVRFFFRFNFAACY